MNKDILKNILSQWSHENFKVFSNFPRQASPPDTDKIFLVSSLSMWSLNGINQIYQAETINVSLID